MSKQQTQRAVARRVPVKKLFVRVTGWLPSACESAVRAIISMLQRAVQGYNIIFQWWRDHRLKLPSTRVLIGLKVFVRSRPAQFIPAPHDFEKSCPLPPRMRTLLTCTRPARYTIPNRARPALFRSQTRTCPKTTTNS